MKTTFKIVAWFGIICTLPYIVWSLYNVPLVIRELTNSLPPFYFNETGPITFLATILFVFGTVLMVVGGAIAKPKYFALASILSGSMYVFLDVGGSCALFRNMDSWGYRR
jgi:hypothetical protein